MEEAMLATTQDEAQLVARLDTLGRTAPAGLAEAVLGLLEHGSPRVRAAAAAAAARMGLRRAIGPLTDLVRPEADPGVAKAALEALQVLGGPEALAPHERILGDPGHPLHRPLLDVLATGPASSRWPPLVKRHLFTAGYPFKGKLIEVLARQRGPETEALLREYLDEPAEALATRAAQGLAAFPSPENYRRLTRRMQSGPWSVQAACFESLLAIEPHPPIADLRPMLTSDHPELVLRALETLAIEPASEAVLELLPLARSGSWKVRAAAALKLGPSYDPRVLPALEELAHDESPAVRAAARTATLGWPIIDHVSAGEAAALDPESEVREVACRHLAEARSASSRAALLELARDRAPEVRLAALDALADHELAAHVDKVRPLANDPDPAVRARAEGLIARYGAPGEAVHVERALEAADAGDHEGARRMLRRLAVDRPRDPRVLYELAKACRRLGEAAEAEVYLRKLVDDHPGHMGARKHLAELLLADHRDAEALVHLREAARSDEANWQLQHQLGTVAMAQGHAREAMGAFESALRVHAGHEPSHRGLARAAEGAGFPERALAEWTYLHKNDPALPEPLFEMGRLALSLGRAAEAASWLARARELGLDSGPLLTALADAYEAVGSRGEALALREECVARGLAGPEGRVALARLLLAAGQPARALALARAARGEDEPDPALVTVEAEALAAMGEPEAALDARIRVLGLDEAFPGARVGYARALAAVGHKEQARAAFARHLELEPFDHQARLELVELELALGRSGAALATLKRGRELAPGELRFLSRAAAVHRGRGEAGEALLLAREAVRLAPKDAAAQLLLGSLYREAGSAEPARKALEAAAALGADDPGLHLDLGRLYLEDGAPAKALIHLERAAPARPEDPELNLALGEALLALHRDERARISLQKARRDGDPRAHRLLARLEATRGSPREALAHLATLKVLAPEDPEAAALEGAARLALGEPGIAIALIEKALARRPGDPALTVRLAEALMAVGDWRRVTELVPGLPLLPTDEPRLKVAKAEAQMRLGNFALAAELAARMVELEPDLMPARALLARALRLQGHLDAALVAVQAARDMDPDHGELALEAAELHLAKGYLDAALADARRGQKTPEAPAGFLLVEARALAARGEHTAACASFQAYLLRDPRAVAGHAGLAASLQALGRLDEAAEAWGNVTSLEPARADAWLALAEVATARGKPRDAVQHLERYLTLDAAPAPALARLARIHEEEGRLEAASTALARLAEVSDGEEARYKLLDLLLRRKDIGAAWPILDRTAEAFPGVPRRLATEAEERGDPVLAKDLWGFVLNREPHDAEALAHLGVCQYRTGAYELARRTFQRTLERLPHHGGAHFYTALLDLMDEKAEDAKPHLLAAIEAQPGNLAAYRHLAKLELGAGAAAEAAAISATGLKHGPGDRELRLLSAAALERLGKASEALAAYAAAGELLVDERSHLPAIRLATRQGDHEAARRLAEAYVAARPEDEAGLRLLARAAAAVGDSARAVEVLVALQQGGDATRDDLKALTQALVATGRTEEAARAAAILVAEPEKASAQDWFLAGSIAAGQGRAHEASERFEAATRLQPAFAEAWRALAEAYLAESRIREALEPAEKAAALKPDEPRHLLVRGRVELRLGRAAKARETLEAGLSAAAAGPLAGELRLELAAALRALGETGNAARMLAAGATGREGARVLPGLAFEAGDFAAAAHHAKAYLAKHPEDAGVLELLGRALTRMGMDAQAKVCLERHLERYGAPEALLDDLSRSRIAKGAASDAVQMLVRGLEARPASATLWRALALARKAKADVAGSMHALEKAHELDPAAAPTMAELGALYVETRAWDKARALYGEALKRDPYKAEYHLGLGRAMREQGDLEDALGHFERAAELDTGSGAAQRELGLLFARMGNRTRAIESLERAVRLAGDDLESLHALARAYRDRGQHDAAEVHFERLAQLSPPRSAEARAAQGYLASRRAA